MRAHIIVNGKVTNTIEVESLDFMPGLIDADRGGKIGDLFDKKDHTFTSPEKPVVEIKMDPNVIDIWEEIENLGGNVPKNIKTEIDKRKVAK